MTSPLVKYLQAGAEALKAQTGAAVNVLSWAGQELPAVFDMDEHGAPMDFGGENPSGDRLTLLIASLDFADDKRPRTGDPATFQGRAYKVESTRAGAAGVVVTMRAPHAR